MSSQESVNSDYLSNCATLGSHDTSTVLVTRTTREVVSRWNETVCVALAFAAVAIGLALSTSHTTWSDGETEPVSRPGAGVITRYEVRCFWVPRSLTALAERQPDLQAVRSHGELRRLLELADQRGVWYAVTTRGHQQDGGFADVTNIHRPYSDPQCLPEFLSVVAAGHPSGSVPAESSMALVRVLDDGPMNGDPHDLIAKRLHELSFGGTLERVP